MIEELYRNGFRNRDGGLHAVGDALDRLQNPQLNIPVVHVAGTNGKGSICTKIAKAYELDGYKVGLYTSPHIDSCCERIQINSKPISEKMLLSFLRKLYEKCGKAFSFFEIMTMIAFLYFFEKKVDVAVFETGLGGIKDATNVCSPILTVISSISLDHTQLLGSTVEAITREKAGIIKDGVRVVIGPNVPCSIVSEYAKLKKAPFSVVSGNFANYDLENSAVATEALSFLPITKDSVRSAVAYRPPCRFERITIGDIEVVLDVAHNADGILKLMQYAGSVFLEKRPVVLLAVCEDKLYEEMLRMLPKGAILVCTQSISERALPASRLAKSAEIVGLSEIFVEKEIKKALLRGLSLAESRETPLIVTGTFYIMGPAQRLLNRYLKRMKNLDSPSCLVEFKGE